MRLLTVCGRVLMHDRIVEGYLKDFVKSEGLEHLGDTEAFERFMRKTLDHFDCVKVGLTATPAAHTVALLATRDNVGSHIVKLVPSYDP